MPANSARLQSTLLRPVSRSFYLSLRGLPSAMREPCSVGYLLARATDTVADRGNASLEDRLALLRDLRELFRQAFPPDWRDQRLAARAQTMLGPSLGSAGERDLIQNLDLCLEWAEHLSGPARASLEKLLDSILTGQIWDLETFGAPLAAGAEPRCLANDAELVQYADWVAGSVGRFWTEIGFMSRPSFSRLSAAELTPLATRYGRALQWLNILRDLHEDLPLGRCYLPGPTLRELGWDNAGSQERPVLLHRAAFPWLEAVDAGLQDGLRYADSIRSRRVRFASVLPAVIGAATLRIMEQSGTSWTTRRVKVSRPGVRKLIARTAARVASGRPLFPFYDQVRR